MTSELIVSVSGIRGIVGQGLTPQAAVAFAAALGSYVDGGAVALGRDSRPSGDMLRHAVLAGLFAAGCEVHDLGIVPTPTVGLAVRRLGARGAIQITASHNPAPWNGLKLFGDDGAVLPAERGLQVKKIYDADAFRLVPFERLGTLRDAGQAEDWHLERVLQLVDVTRIRSRGFRVLLDANAGAGGALGQRLLEALQCQPTVLGAFPDGAFLHPPEPLAENLATVLARVPQARADVGFVLDPDADRLAIIDETGRYLGEELTLALAAACRLRQEKGPVVVNMSSSRVVEDIAQSHGVVCQRAAVGEANVVGRMRQLGAVLGGEGNGGVIDPRVGWVRDPYIGMALVLDLMAETGQTLGQLVNTLPAYTIVKDKYEVSRDRLPDLYRRLQQRWPESRVNHEDGLRLDWPDRWVHVRGSNTEPIVRVIAEAPRAEDARQLCGEVGRLLVENQ